MKIKSIELKNHDILGDIFLDFTDLNGRPLDTIILAGENGVGKSRILDLIFKFSEFKLEFDKSPTYKKKIVVETSQLEIDILTTSGEVVFVNGIFDGELVFTYDYSDENWGQIKISFKDNKGIYQQTSGNVFGNALVKNNEHLRDAVFKCVFSDVEINFSPKEIASVTAEGLDRKGTGVLKSNPNLATEITQLLINTQALDDAEISQWVIKKENHGLAVPKSVIQNRRMKRFTDAFEYMFPSKSYKDIRNFDNKKQIVFEEYGREIYIKDLSSGEKQIIFRGGFLLRDKQSNNGALILIDEPEISLHPKWQLRVLEFYKKLFTNEKGVQTSQIFIATHSPFIIHNESRGKDKVIILKKNSAGKIQISKNAEYMGWSHEKEVAEAFNINFSKSVKPLILTEGKTDSSLLEIAWSKLNKEELPFEIISVGEDTDKNNRSGNANLVKRTLELIANIEGRRPIIGLFDNDIEGYAQFNGLNKNYFDKEVDGIRKHKSKNIYGMLLPVPTNRKKFVTKVLNQKYLTIEHFFPDHILEKNGMKGDGILGSKVFSIKGNKKTFVKKSAYFNKAEFKSFVLVFDSIKKII